MQTKLDFELAEYVRSVNKLMIAACGMTAYDIIDQLWRNCLDHGLTPSDAVAMFLADNEHLLASDE